MLVHARRRGAARGPAAAALGRRTLPALPAAQQGLLVDDSPAAADAERTGAQPARRGRRASRDVSARIASMERCGSAAGRPRGPRGLLGAGGGLGHLLADAARWVGRGGRPTLAAAGVAERQRLDARRAGWRKGGEEGSGGASVRVGEPVRRGAPGVARAAGSSKVGKQGQASNGHQRLVHARVEGGGA